MKVAVAGGTGLVGQHVVRALEARGHTAVVLARSRGVDLTTGQGLDAALAGVAAVVDVSNVTSLRRRTAMAFFRSATRELLVAGQRAGVAHHLVLSIVGVDRVPTGYYQAKLLQESLALRGTTPVTVLRATQFHEFAAQVLQRQPGPVAVVPRMLVQPVAAREVGAHLAELATGPALGLAPELAGPEVHLLPGLVRRLVRSGRPDGGSARGGRTSPRLVLGVPLPGATGRALARGALLPLGDGPRGRETFRAWLASERGEPPSA